MSPARIPVASRVSRLSCDQTSFNASCDSTNSLPCVDALGRFQVARARAHRNARAKTLARDRAFSPSRAIARSSVGDRIDADVSAVFIHVVTPLATIRAFVSDRISTTNGVDAIRARAIARATIEALRCRVARDSFTSHDSRRTTDFAHTLVS